MVFAMSLGCGGGECGGPLPADCADPCFAYVEKNKAIYEECGAESPVEDDFCEQYADSQNDCTEYLECLGNAYVCEDDGTVSNEADDCGECE